MSKELGYERLGGLWDDNGEAREKARKRQELILKSQEEHMVCNFAPNEAKGEKEPPAY